MIDVFKLGKNLMSWTLLPFKDLVDDVKEDVFWKMVQAGPMSGIIHCWKITFAV